MELNDTDLTIRGANIHGVKLQWRPDIASWRLITVEVLIMELDSYHLSSTLNFEVVRNIVCPCSRLRFMYLFTHLDTNIFLNIKSLELPNFNYYLVERDSICGLIRGKMAFRLASDSQYNCHIN